MKNKFVLTIFLIVVNKLQEGNFFTKEEHKIASDCISDADLCRNTLKKFRVLNEINKLTNKWSIIFNKVNIDHLVAIDYNTNWVYLVNTHQSITKKLNKILTLNGSLFKNYNNVFSVYENSLCNGLEAIDKFEKQEINNSDILPLEEYPNLDNLLKDYSEEEYYNNQ